MKYLLGISLVAQMVKSLPAMWETQVQFLGQKDPRKKEMATHSSIRAWKIPWTEKSGGLQSMGHKELDMTEHIWNIFYMVIISSSEASTTGSRHYLHMWWWLTERLNLDSTEVRTWVGFY